jgi:hypothetical protein
MNSRQSSCAIAIFVAAAALVGCDEPPPYEQAASRDNFEPGHQVGPPAPAENPPRTGQVPSSDQQQSEGGLLAVDRFTPKHGGNHMDSKPSSGCSNGLAKDPSSRLGLEYFQRFRQHIGLPCVETPDYSQSAAAWHAIYISEHFRWLGNDECALDGHSEKAGCTYFSGTTPRLQQVNNGMPEEHDYVAQVTGDCIGCTLKSGDFMAGMFSGPFHRASMMRPWAKFAGFATFYSDHAQVETWANTLVTSGVKAEIPDTTQQHSLLFYPVPGDSNVPLFFHGVETPQPIAPPAGWPSGYPVTIVANANAEITGTAFCKVEGGTCTHVPHVAMVNSTDSRVATNVGHLYAHHKLEPNTVYRAQFTGKFNGTWDTIWWEFRTKKEPAVVCPIRGTCTPVN